MKSVKKVLALLVLLVFLPATVFAHSGRTDSSGGHKDNKNKSGLGSYHYHCGGHSPHLHEGGACPYAKDSSSSSSKATAKPSPTPRPTPKPVADKEIDETRVGEEVIGTEFPIKRGDKNEWVKAIQEKLIILGYLFDAADGVFGDKTKAAVAHFQKDHGFEEDGIVTEAVYIAMIYWEFED